MSFSISRAFKQNTICTQTLRTTQAHEQDYYKALLAVTNNSMHAEEESSYLYRHMFNSIQRLQREKEKYAQNLLSYHKIKSSSWHRLKMVFSPDYRDKMTQASIKLTAACHELNYQLHTNRQLLLGYVIDRIGGVNDPIKPSKNFEGFIDYLPSKSPSREYFSALLKYKTAEKDPMTEGKPSLLEKIKKSISTLLKRKTVHDSQETNFLKTVHGRQFFNSPAAVNTEKTTYLPQQSLQCFDSLRSNREVIVKSAIKKLLNHAEQGYSPAISKTTELFFSYLNQASQDQEPERIIDKAFADIFLTRSNYNKVITIVGLTIARGFPQANHFYQILQDNLNNRDTLKNKEAIIIIKTKLDEAINSEKCKLDARQSIENIIAEAQQKYPLSRINLINHFLKACSNHLKKAPNNKIDLTAKIMMEILTKEPHTCRQISSIVATSIARQYSHGNMTAKNKINKIKKRLSKNSLSEHETEVAEIIARLERQLLFFEAKIKIGQHVLDIIDEACHEEDAVNKVAKLFFTTCRSKIENRRLTGEQAACFDILENNTDYSMKLIRVIARSINQQNKEVTTQYETLVALIRKQREEHTIPLDTLEKIVPILKSIDDCLNRQHVLCMIDQAYAKEDDAANKVAQLFFTTWRSKINSHINNCHLMGMQAACFNILENNADYSMKLIHIIARCINQKNKEVITRYKTMMALICKEPEEQTIPSDTLKKIAPLFNSINDYLKRINEGNQMEEQQMEEQQVEEQQVKKQSEEPVEKFSWDAKNLEKVRQEMLGEHSQPQHKHPVTNGATLSRKVI